MSMGIERIEELQVDARDRGFMWVVDKMDKAELLHLLRCARVVADLGQPGIFTLRGELLLDDRWRVESGFRTPGIGFGPDILTSIEAALARARDGGA